MSKSIPTIAREALEAGDAIVAGAVYIATAPEPVAVWGGYAPLTIDGQIYQPIGNNGVATASGGSLGAAAQATTLTLSGVEPANLELFDAGLLKDVPVVLYALVFDSSGRTLLAAIPWVRGRLDQLPVTDVPGGTSTITAMIEGAARGLGRARARMRTDADQKLDDPDDDGFKTISYAGQKTLYTGGKPPSQAADVGRPDLSWRGLAELARQ